MIRRVTILACVLTTCLAVAAPAMAARNCKGTVRTSQPNGGALAKNLAVKGTSCKVGFSVARHWTGKAGSTPKDYKGQRWSFSRGMLLTRGIRSSFVRHKAKISWTSLTGTP